jgi:two-component sensor histidine kinase
LSQALRSLVRDVLRGVGTDGAIRIEIRPNGTAALLDVAVDVDCEIPLRGRFIAEDSLGVALVSAVARLHGGSFAVRDAPQGVVASLQLPR